MSEHHFIIFRRTDGHCVTWLMQAPSLRQALVQYALQECSGAELCDDGSIAVDDGYGGKIVYSHPLACIEAEEKVWDGSTHWNGWEVRQLQQQHWDAPFAEVFCSEQPSAVEEYIEMCRPLLRQRHPRSRARAFVWYLIDGPLVTFYRPTRRGRRQPIEILGRYQLPSTEWPHACEWSGTHDDILKQMWTEYPLP
jgi:hypothetical protein